MSKEARKENRCKKIFISILVRYFLGVEGNPVSSFDMSVLFTESFKDSTIFLNNSSRSEIILITDDKHFFKTYFLRFFESQSKHLGTISLPSFAGANTVADMTSSFDKIWMIDMMTNLNCTENPPVLYEEK